MGYAGHLYKLLDSLLCMRFCPSQHCLLQLYAFLWAHIANRHEFSQIKWCISNKKKSLDSHPYALVDVKSYFKQQLTSITKA